MRFLGTRISRNVFPLFNCDIDWHNTVRTKKNAVVTAMIEHCSKTSTAHSLHIYIYQGKLYENTNVYIVFYNTCCIFSIVIRRALFQETVTFELCYISRLRLYGTVSYNNAINARTHMCNRIQYLQFMPLSICLALAYLRGVHLQPKAFICSLSDPINSRLGIRYDWGTLSFFTFP